MLCLLRPAKKWAIHKHICVCHFLSHFLADPLNCGFPFGFRFNPPINGYPQRQTQTNRRNTKFFESPASQTQHKPAQGAKWVIRKKEQAVDKLPKNASLWQAPWVSKATQLEAEEQPRSIRYAAGPMACTTLTVSRSVSKKHKSSTLRPANPDMLHLFE